VSSKKHIDALKALVADKNLNIETWTGIKKGAVDLRVPPGARDRVQAAIANVLPCKVLIDDVQKYIDVEITLPSIEERKARNAFHKSYHSIEEINGYLDGLIAGHPNIAKKVFFPGKSYEGRESTGVSISAGSNKPVVFWHGGEHAREWISTATIVYIADKLISGYASDPSIKCLVDNYEIVLLPVANPDGYVYSRSTDRMWRKNRQPNAGSECVGTDTNRNWGYFWNTGGSSDDQCEDNYHGPSAFSAPETKNLADYIKLRKPLIYADIHAYSQLLMTPNGYSCEVYPENSAELVKIANGTATAIQKLYGTEFTVGPICETVYLSSGSSVDWVYAEGKVKFPFAFELRDTGDHGFLLPPNQIIPTGEETFAGFKYMLETIRKSPSYK